MSFNSLSRVLTELSKQPAWENQQQHYQLLQIWQDAVKPEVALQTRPLYIARKMLWVATSSSAWAQTLSLKRYSLLKKLNAQLSEPLTDIRFSTAQWHQNRDRSVSQSDSSVHPSRVSGAKALPPEGDSPRSAFERWSQGVRSRSQHLPNCPQCQRPAPKGELQRWGLCCHCVAQQWHSLK